MSDTKNIPQVETIQQIVEAAGPVQYIPHALDGAWAQFLAQKGPTDDWDVNALLRNLVDYVFQTVETPVIVSQLHSTARDETPSYKVTCFSLTYGQLIEFDQRAQRAWFKSVVVQPVRDLFDVKLVPSRTLMKLIYTTVI